ncbi:uracil-xanthine permease family protein [Anaerococcus porci]|uniref:Purine permease n=1 Tax=Anaerococcus porci TaxID=2652269 RepID=A0A6N7VES4_9FIRM|nr:solute carrier family 23 protein [Anaerococcus porci]MDY3005707.1 solute carrier family 23 protein [Anaerococcus porci]MSS77930.1 purine permease [Anaerococcus porci]
MTEKSKFKGLFNFDGKVTFKEALPLAFQHVVAMIAGCITPPIMLAAATGLSPENTIILIQIALIGSALTSLLMIYPIKIIGSRLPMIFGVSFAYVPTMIALAGQFGARGPMEVVAIILGAQLIGGIFSILFGLGLKYILPLFPPLVSGTVVLVIGLSLYPVAMNYMGGAGSVDMAGWGAWQNWLVGGITLILSLGFTHFGKGMFKLANVLFAMIIGYIISMFFGMVDFSPVRDAGWISVVEPLHFGISFEPSAIVSISIIFIVTAIEGIGDMTSTTVGGMDRVPTQKELRGGIIGYGVANVIGAFLGCLPTATFSQNAGIVSINKVVNKKVFTIASLIILISGLVPKLSSILTTIPYPVLGGATLSVFAAITMNGIRMITSQPLTGRNTSIVGVSVALGVGFTSVVASAQNSGVNFMPEALTIAIGSSPVVLATISSVLMNLIIPEKEEDRPKDDSIFEKDLIEIEK